MYFTNILEIISLFLVVASVAFFYLGIRFRKMQNQFSKMMTELEKSMAAKRMLQEELKKSRDAEASLQLALNQCMAKVKE